MYIEIIGFGGNRATIRFHEGALHNRIFEGVHMDLLLKIIVSQKILVMGVTPTIYRITKSKAAYQDPRDQEFMNEFSQALKIK